MIVFHEGLPGSGKSFEACVFHILPALKQGRRVVTNIEGINHEKFAELSGIPECWLIEKLICVYDLDIDVQKQKFLEHSQKDSLIVIDEIQNLFPSDRTKLSDAWNKYITEHRHEGLDIILMGQDRRDCHAMWRRRIQRVILFLKLTAVGKENSYRWQCFEATRPEKFKEITSGVRKYDPHYFGLYASHTEGTGHKSNYLDKRANVFNSKGIRYGIPLFILVLIFSISNLYDFFTPTEAIASESTIVANSPTSTTIKTTTTRKVSNQAQTTAPEKPVEPPPLDVFDEFAGKYRLRLSAFIESTEDYIAYIDILDDSFHLKDRYEPQHLRELGWNIEVKSYGLRLTKKGKEYVARPWPKDRFGQINNSTRTQL